MMLYLFYNGVSYRLCQIFDDKGVENNRKGFYARRSMVDGGNWSDFFNKCYFPIKKTTDIVDIIGHSDISIKIIKDIDKTTHNKV